MHSFWSARLPRLPDSVLHRDTGVDIFDSAMAEVIFDSAVSEAIFRVIFHRQLSGRNQARQSLGPFLPCSIIGP